MKNHRVSMTATARPGLLATALASLAFMTAPAQALELDEVLQRHYQARGGLEAIRAVDSYRVSGTLDSAGNLSPYTLEGKRRKLTGIPGLRHDRHPGRGGRCRLAADAIHGHCRAGRDGC